MRSRAPPVRPMTVSGQFCPAAISSRRERADGSKLTTMREGDSEELDGRAELVREFHVRAD